MKEAKTKVQITEQICKQIRLMRKGGANQTEIGALIGINPSTVSRIEKAGFDVEKYLENKRMAREKEKAAKEQPAEEQEREPEVPGQMQMELSMAPTVKPVEGIQVEIDQARMMRFLAGQMDRLYMKMETINDTLSQILRALRKE